MVLSRTPTRTFPCPRCAAPAARYHITEPSLFEPIFPAETYDLEICPCGWTQRRPATEVAA